MLDIRSDNVPLVSRVTRLATPIPTKHVSVRFVVGMSLKALRSRPKRIGSNIFRSSPSYGSAHVLKVCHLLQMGRINTARIRTDVAAFKERRHISYPVLVGNLVRTSSNWFNSEKSITPFVFTAFPYPAPAGSEFDFGEEMVKLFRRHGSNYTTTTYAVSA